MKKFRKMKVWQGLALLLVLLAGWMVLSAFGFGSATVDGIARTMWARYLRAAEIYGTSTEYKLTIGNPDRSDVVEIYDATVTGFNTAPNVVWIDSVDDLSTWNGADSGQSYFQTVAGRTYIVDLHAINASGTAPTSGVSSISFTGVTAILPDASIANNKNQVTILVGTSGATGYATAASGVTIVQVWPYAGSGATRYGEPSVDHQNMVVRPVISGHTAYQVNSDAVATFTGRGDTTINNLGESVTWMLMYNSAVSAQIIASSVDR